MHGTGCLKFADGSMYEGAFENHKRQGEGKFTFADGVSFYEGAWKDGQQDGEGIYSNKDGVKRKGRWNKGIREGEWLDNNDV